MRLLATATLVAFIAAPALAQEKVDYAAVQKIRDEAFGANSQVMETLRHLTDGTEERFLTQRHYGTGRPRAEAALNAMRTELLEAGLTILEVEAEYVVCDTNAGLDAGWLDNL